jgi:hypothetical protein
MRISLPAAGTVCLAIFFFLTKNSVLIGYTAYKIRIRCLSNLNF